MEINENKYICMDERGSVRLFYGEIYIATKEKEGYILIGGSWYRKGRFRLCVDNQKNLPLLEALQEKEKCDGGICSYAIEFENKERRYQPDDACHYRIRYGKGVYADGFNSPAIALCESLAMHFNRLDPGKIEGYIEYVDYILNHSLWSSIFIGNKDKESIQKSKGVYLDVTRGINEVISALVALRVGSEYNRSLPLFNKLYKEEGIPSDVAWIVSQSMYWIGKSYSVDLSRGVHHCLSRYSNFKQLCNTFNTKIFANPGTPYNKAVGEGFVICSAIGKENSGVSFEDEFDTLTKDWETSVKDWGAVVKVSSYEGVVKLAKELAALVAITK